jgi:DNA-directed RNA polymerase specialized sigma24 family protein
MDSISEIACKFGIGESKVKSMLMRTREQLREFLKKGGFIV